jgi:signal transduction histidine kinase
MQQLNPLLRLLQDLTAELDYDHFLQAVASAAGELTDSEAASLLEYDEASDQLRFVAAPWFHWDALQDVQVPVEESVAGWVCRNKVHRIIQDMTAENLPYYHAADRITDFKTHSLLAVPVMLKGHVVGVLEALNKTEHAHYTEEDVETLKILASLAALTLHARALEKRAKQVHDTQAQLNEMKSDFIAIASHELRTPLGLILGHATFLREVADEEYSEQLDAIVRSAGRLKEIIENLSNVNTVESGGARIHSTRFFVEDLVNEVVASFEKDAAEKNISFHISIEDKTLSLEGDVGKINIALGNLVRNAVTFTKEGGHVGITAEAIPGYVKIAVIDDGIGIPAKDLPYIFERFYQVESHLTRRHGGMGLGLAVAKAMIEMHGGRIWAESREGKGSIFTFILPSDTASSPNVFIS